MVDLLELGYVTFYANSWDLTDLALCDPSTTFLHVPDAPDALQTADDVDFPQLGFLSVKLTQYHELKFSP